MWKKQNTNKPAVGTPVLTGEAGAQVWKDADGDVVLATTASDLPQGVEQSDFMGIPRTPPAEGETHSIVIKIAADVALIKQKLGI